MRDLEAEANWLRLFPSGPIGQLELAAVGGAVLGLDDEVADILALAREYAPRFRLDYLVPKMEAGVQEAKLVGARCP